MFEGNWKCSSCGGTITQLPFQPKSEANLVCRECYTKKSGNTNTQGAAKSDGERKKFAGDWSCSGCGTAITELPFEPRDTSGLLCMDCFKKKKAG